MSQNKPIICLLLDHLLHWLHCQSIIRTCLDTKLTSCAIIRQHLDAVIEAIEIASSIGLHGLEGVRTRHNLAFVDQEWPDHPMWTHIAAVVALRALVCRPSQHLIGNHPLLELHVAMRDAASNRKRADQNLISLQASHRLHHLLNELRKRYIVEFE